MSDSAIDEECALPQTPMILTGVDGVSVFISNCVSANVSDSAVGQGCLAATFNDSY